MKASSSWLPSRSPGPVSYTHLPQAVRDLVAQIGKRLVVQRASRPEVQSVALKIGMHISQRLIGKGISRWIPVFGALGAGAYAYYCLLYTSRCV